MKLFIFIMSALIILFFPVRIKLSVKFIDKHLSIKIFGKELLKEKKKKKKKKQKENVFQFESIKKIANKLNKAPLKPSVKFNMDIHYGLEDAAVTAILYGLFQSIFSLIYNVFSLYFKVKKFAPKANPVFNKEILNLEIKSIITINLANIIYITIIILNMFLNMKLKKFHVSNKAKTSKEQ